MGNTNTNSIQQRVQQPIISLNGLHRCQQCLQQTRSQLDNQIQLVRQYQQIPFAEPIQNNTNPYAPPQQHKATINKIIQSQPIILSIQSSKLFSSSNCMSLDQKYWKKSSPDIVISGTWDNHYPHGLVTLYFNNSFIFISYFNHGEPIYDDCLLIYPNLNYYHGGIKNGKFQKKGKYYSDQFVYDGEWKDGLPNGDGVEKFIKQNVEYHGRFINGQKQGINSVYKVMNQSGQQLYKYQGQFKNNDFYQQGKLYLNQSNNNTIIKTDFTSHYPLVQFKQIKAQQYKLLNTIIQRDMSIGTTTIIQNKSKHDSSFKQIPSCEYPAQLVNGRLHGKCLAGNLQIDYHNEKQEIYWFNGYKLKKYQNFNNQKQKQTQILLNQIQNYYRQAKKYSEIVEKLKKQYAYKYKFKIVKEKDANQIIKQKNDAKKKQILVELTQGIYIYVYTE